MKKNRRRDRSGWCVMQSNTGMKLPKASGQADKTQDVWSIRAWLSSQCAIDISIALRLKNWDPDPPQKAQTAIDQD